MSHLSLTSVTCAGRAGIHRRARAYFWRRRLAGAEWGIMNNLRFVFDRAPVRVYWEITKSCDLACRHCRAEAQPLPDPRELTTQEGFALLERLAAFGDPKPHVVLTGGDPLKRKDLFALIAHARGLGLDVSLSPSGTPLLTAEAIQRIKAAGIDAISLSLDGSNAERQDAIRGVPGCFQRTVDAARAACAVGLPFQVNTLVAQETLDDVRNLLPLVREIGAARWSLFFLITVGRGTVLNPISATECESLFEWLASIPREPGMPIITTTEAPHYRRVLMQRKRSLPVNDAAPQHAHPHAAHGGGGKGMPPGVGIRDGNGILFVSSVGDVTPSGFLPLAVANVRTQDVVEVYRNAPAFQQLRHVDDFEGRCGRCEFRNACGGSRARAYAASGGQLLAEDPLCSHQPRG